MSTNRRPPKDPTVFDDIKLYLTTTPITAGDMSPRLRIKLYENNPVIDVSYGQKTDKGFQIKHETPIDPIVLGNILTMIELAARSKGAVSFEIDNWGHPFFWDKETHKNVRSKEKMNVSRLEIGRRETGEVYLKYMAVKKPELEFVFSDSQDYHKLIQDGNPMSTSVSSMIAALSWSKAINAIYYSFYSTKWEEPEWRKRSRLERIAKHAGSGGGGGGYNKPAGDQAPSNNYSSNHDDDDDIPF